MSCAKRHHGSIRHTKEHAGLFRRLDPFPKTHMTSRIAFYTLGCKVNQAETDAISDQFAQLGYVCVPFETEADVYVVNTCTVTHVADAKSRHILRQARRTNPDALVVATGCYASIVRDQLPVGEVLVVRNRDKDKLVPLVEQRLGHSDAQVDLEKPKLQGFLPQCALSRARPNVKAQDGCDAACAYCIIPRARGRSRSVAPEKIVARVRQLVDQGHKEVVITGVDLGSYGEDDEGFPDLGGLLEMLLAATRLYRVRVSSVEPGDFKLRWLDLWSGPRLCRHLHIPLQSGSDSVLARMRRRYDSSQFFKMIDACRRHIPGLAITTDVITGFPGETDSEFAAGLSFIEECEFDGLHVFPYSPRPGTAAAHLPNHVDDYVKKDRAATLRSLAESRKRAHIARKIGDQVEVVWESDQDGIWRGMSDDNIRVYSSDSHLSVNSLDSRRLCVAYADGCWGEVVETSSKASRIPLVAV